MSLFASRRLGTGIVAGLFGPVVVVWGVDPIRYHDLPLTKTILMGHSMQLP